MSLNDKVKLLTTENVLNQRGLDDSFNKKSEDEIIKKAYDIAIDSLTNKEKFTYYYENN